MSETRGSITIAGPAGMETYILDGQIKTVGDAVRRFAGDGELPTRIQVGTTHGSFEELDTRELQPGDTVLTLAGNVARHGFKGA